MTDLRDLYEEVILDHNRHPRNFGNVPEGANHTAQGVNPLCGDQIELHLRVSDGVIEDAGFTGAGCAISTASASLMTEAVKGLNLDQAERLFAGVRAAVTDAAEEAGADIGKLAVLAGVRDYPMRVKCATLAWHTLHAALDESAGVVTTE